MSETIQILEFTISESLALDRVLLDILEAHRKKRKSVSIPLTNDYFVEQLQKIRNKRFYNSKDYLEKLKSEMEREI